MNDQKKRRATGVQPLCDEACRPLNYLYPITLIFKMSR